MGSFGCTWVYMGVQSHLTSSSCLIIPNSVRKLNKSEWHKTCTKHLLGALMICESVCKVRITMCYVPGNWWYEHENMLMLYSSPHKRWISNKRHYLKPQPNYHISSLWIECLTYDFVCTTCEPWKLSSCTIASSIHLPWLCMFFC